MVYNDPGYFVRTYFPRYFINVLKTEPDNGTNYAQFGAVPKSWDKQKYWDKYYKQQKNIHRDDREVIELITNFIIQGNY